MFLILDPSSDTVESTDDLIIKYDGTNEIEISILVNSIKSVANVIQGINRELNTGESIQIEVSSIENGSLIVFLRLKSFFQNLRRTVFTNENISTTANIIAIVGGIYGLMLFLKGSPPEVVDKGQESVVIKNKVGEVTIVDNRVFNIYIGNNEVHNNAADGIESIQKDDRITNFEILDKAHQSLVKIPKSAFSSITAKKDTSETPQTRIVAKQGMLNIETLSFDHKVKWTFIYEGHKISAKIGDEEFAKVIDSGEKFAKGDKLEAELEILQEYDNSVDVYVIKGYTITKIISHIPRKDPSNLDFGEE